MTNETSPSLLLRLRRGSDAAAWERFIDLYTPLMVRWAARLGAQSSDAADLVQDSLVTLIRVLPSFDYDQNGSFRSWLRTMITNKWRDRLRKQAPKLVPAEAFDFVADHGDPSPADDLEERAALCRRGLELIRGEFSAATWTAFTATAVDGRPVAEVAEEVGITANAVYLARSRVLTRLRDELAGLWD